MIVMNLCWFHIMLNFLKTSHLISATTRKYIILFPHFYKQSLKTDTTSWVRVLTVTPGPTSQPLPYSAGC